MRRYLLSATALALTAGFAAPAQAEFRLTILHINDFHSRFEPINAFDSTCDAETEAAGECFGGIARLRAAIDQRRSELEDNGENVVLLSAGDEFQGSLFYTHYKSEIVADFMNDMGFDAVATGNHEFDDGPEEFAKFIEAAEFPILGGNFDSSEDPELAGRPPGVLVLNIDGEQVAIIGAVTEDTPDIASPGPDVEFQSVVDYSSGAVGALEEAGINKIIVLSHIGYTVDQNLAASVSGVDVIVGGHSHTLLSNTDEAAAGPYPTMTANPDGDDVAIVQAGQYGKYLGELQVTWDDEGNVVSAEGDPLLLDASITPDEEFAERLAELGAPLEELKSEVIGTATEAIEGSREVCRAMECSMGNLIADAILDRTRDQGMQIAIQNGGGIRASIDAGEITMGEVLTVLPFSNTLATFQLPGDDLLASLENGVSQVEDGGGRFPQVAGLRYTFDVSQPVGERISDVEVQEGDDWVPLDPEKTYGIVTNNFVRNGGDGYELFASNAVDPYDFGPPLEIVVADYIAAQGGTYTPYTDGRITDATPAAETAPEAEEDAAEPATEAPAEPAAETPATGDAVPADDAESVTSEAAPEADAEGSATPLRAPAMTVPDAGTAADPEAETGVGAEGSAVQLRAPAMAAPDAAPAQ
jgi:5'-nucleotidase/UDP-sugar diphosphatase